MPNWNSHFTIKLRVDFVLAHPVVILAKAGVQRVAHAKRKTNACLSATLPLMPRGSHFSCFAKKSNQKKATPTIGLFLRCSEKSGTKKTRYRSNSFSF